MKHLTNFTSLFNEMRDFWFHIFKSDFNKLDFGIDKTSGYADSSYKSGAKFNSKVSGFKDYCTQLYMLHTGNAQFQTMHPELAIRFFKKAAEYFSIAVSVSTDEQNKYIEMVYQEILKLDKEQVFARILKSMPTNYIAYDEVQRHHRELEVKKKLVVYATKISDEILHPLEDKQKLSKKDTPEYLALDKCIKDIKRLNKIGLADLGKDLTDVNIQKITEARKQKMLDSINTNLIGNPSLGEKAGPMRKFGRTLANILMTITVVPLIARKCLFGYSAWLQVNAPSGKSDLQKDVATEDGIVCKARRLSV